MFFSVFRSFQVCVPIRRLKENLKMVILKNICVSRFKVASEGPSKIIIVPSRNHVHIQKTFGHKSKTKSLEQVQWNHFSNRTTPIWQAPNKNKFHWSSFLLLLLLLLFFYIGKLACPSLFGWHHIYRSSSATSGTHFMCVMRRGSWINLAFIEMGSKKALKAF